MKDIAYATLASANTNIEATISGRPGESSSAAYQPRECIHVTLVALCQRCCFDVGPPFVGQEPSTRSTEELLVGGRR